MEPLTVGLGFAISKAVFKAWFKDNEFASSASEGINDLLKGVVVDRKARNSAERHLLKIANDSADSISDYIEFQWPELTEYDKIDAINVVDSAIENLNINSAFMANIEFSADRLSALLADKLLLGALSEEAGRLAIVIANESAQLISDLASSLPEFHRDTFAEVLKRETLIIERLDKVFTEIQAIRDSVSKESPNIANALFESSYRKAVARELDRIELFGLDTGIKQSSRQHSLSTAYISLSVSGIADSYESEDKNITDDESGSDSKSAISVRVEEAANLSNFVIIKGEAGSGKTTLLQSFAVQCATASYRDHMERWNDLIPFFVRLRAIAGKGLPRPEELPGLVAPIIAGTMPTGWAHEQLRAGRALLLVDGLDEVSPDRRDETRRWIDSLVSEFPTVRIIVTSRPTAVADNWLENKGFRQLELLAMSPDDVGVFIDHWHEAVANEEQIKSKRDGISLLVPALKERIRIDRPLRELAATPLLCAMLCAMNKDRKQVLPTNRISLYEAAVYTILHGRDEERKIKNENSVRLDLETKVGIIQEVSFWMMQNGASMVDQWRIEDFVSTIIRSYTKIPKAASPKDIVNTLVLRSGIIRSPIEGKVDFVHNAFKEYFAAKAVSAGDRFGYLQTMLHNEAWREVAVLAVAMTDEVRRRSFIDEVLKYGDSNYKSRATYHLLAVRCLETCTQLAEELQEGIKVRLNSLQPPATLTEARSLSAAGGLALPLLKHQNHNARTAAACVRALRLIGTPEAMEYLSSYAGDVRATVGKEVVAAWPFFETLQYAKDVLSKSPGIYGLLRIDHPMYLEGLKYLVNAQGIMINLRSMPVPDWAIKDLKTLDNLRRILIYSGGQLNLSDYIKFENLRYLNLTADNLIGCDAIKDLPDLYRLTVHGEFSGKVNLEDLPKSVNNLSLYCPELVLEGSFPEPSRIRYISLLNQDPANNLDSLDQLNNLSEVTLGYVKNEREWQIVSAKNELRTLRVFSQFAPDSLGELPLKDLRDFSISGAKNLRDISAIAGLSNLHNLSISGSELLEDIEPLKNLENLRHLSIETKVGVDLSILRELPRIVSIRTIGGKIVKHTEYIGR